jgi:hypothetical protein
MPRGNLQIFYSSPYDRSSLMESSLSFCLRMAFVISKYLVHAMFFEYGECLLEVWNAFPHATRREWISNTKFMLFSVQKFMLVYVSSSLPPQKKKKDKHVVSGLWFMKPYKSDFMKPIHFIVEHIFRGSTKKSWELRTRSEGLVLEWEAFSIKVLIGNRGLMKEWNC